MADNTVLNTGSGGDTIATDEIGGIKFQRVKLTLGTDGVNGGDVSTSNPIPVSGYSVISPQSSLASALSVSAGASSDLDSSQISSGTTGKLIQIWLGSSVPVKYLLKTVQNSVEISKAVIFTESGKSIILSLADKKFLTQAQDAGAGFDGFRVTATNLDTTKAADLYATFFWDETN